MPCKKKCCYKVKCEDRCGCRFKKFDCDSLLKSKNGTQPTDPMLDYGATVSSNGFRALIPYNHLSGQVSQLVSTNTQPFILQDNSLAILVSISSIVLRRLLIRATNPPSVPVTFAVYIFGPLDRPRARTTLEATLLPGQVLAVGESVTNAASPEQIAVLVEPTSIPQNLGYVTASVAYEETFF